MPRELNIKGTIISNDSKWLYDLFEMDSTCPRDIIVPLKEVAGTEDIIIYMNSPGGNCDAADEIYTAISTYKGNIEIRVVGLAASAAPEILMACKSYISPVGKVMIHNATTYASGDYRDMDSVSNMLKKYNQAIQNAYKAKVDNSGKEPITDSELKELMDATTFMTAQEAVDKGFVDELLPTNNDSITTVYNAVAPILNEDKIRELSMMLIKTKKKKSETQASTSVLSNEGGNTNVTIEELRTEHPELSNELETMISNAREEGAKSERERLHAIDEIADAEPESMLVDAKYKNPCSASELSLKVMKSSVKDGESYLKSAVKDSKDSGVGKVSTGAPPENNENNDEELAEIVAKAANAGRKAYK